MHFSFIINSYFFITATTSWKDDYAVKTLIDEWREHKSYFKSTTITNKKV